MRTRMYGGVTGKAGDRLPMSIQITALVCLRKSLLPVEWLAARGRNGFFRGGGHRVVGRLREQARRLERFERVGIVFPSQGRSPDFA
jgi:hypothetical protein